MMRQPRFQRFDLDPRSTPPVTKAYAIAILVVSLVGSVTQRSFGFGVADLQFRARAVLSGEIWRLFTYAFVESTPFGLLLSLVVLYFFGRFLEETWGRRDFRRFVVWSAVGAACLAIPFGWLTNAVLPFRDPGVAEGPGAVFDAMLVAMALQAPDSNVLFGFLLPIKARTLVLLILGFHLIAGIQTGAASLGITLGGMTMGYLLTTGNWRPGRWGGLWRRVSRRRRGRRGLHVVPPPDHTTWH